MKGYKVFNPDFTCRGFQYEVGKTYEEDVVPSVCKVGFHFCPKLVDCFSCYDFDPNNKVAEIEAIGDIDEGDNKCCTNKITIVKEIAWQEVLEIVNTGKGDTGLRNSGNYNSGNRNSGNRNSGNWNSGNRNSGDYNSGNRNSGDYNSGNRNSGDCNSGNRNSGHCNSGDCNSGDCNSGDYNSGIRNSGDCNSGLCNSGDYNSGNRNSGLCNSGDGNSGDWNSGDYNSGIRNSGDCNSGLCNSGDYNSGNWNSGDWNKTSFSSGVFCTEQPKLIMFNKPTEITFAEWENSRACRLLNRIDLRPTEFIWPRNMTDEEKAAHPEWETTEGYLKKLDTSECCHNWWMNLSMEEKCAIQNMPNFDAEIFKEITGIQM